MAKSVKLIIYLIKEDINPSDFLKKKFDSFDVDDVGKFYTESSIVNKPSWLSTFFLSKLDESLFKVASSKGLFIVPVQIDGKDVYFVISFGSGRHMLNDDIVEERFGLRVTLNSIDASSIRSIEKSTFGAISKSSKEQLTKASTAKDFGIDVEQDLVRTLTGKSKVPKLGKTITGVDSLSISTRCDIKSIIDLLKICHRQYLSEDYQIDFDWIDKIQEIKIKSLISQLNSLLIDELNSKNFENIWMSVPEIIDWNDLAGFKYLPRQKEFSDDIYIDTFISSFETGIANLSQLKAKRVTAYSASHDAEMISWSAFKCLYGEFKVNNKQYILNYGKWYEIENNFVDAVNISYESIPLADIELPHYNHENEGDYNEKAAGENPDFLLMDKKNILHGGRGNKIEFCDIFTKKVNWFISNTMEHLLF